MKTKNLKSVVWRDGNGYTAQCLTVDVASCGDTKEEAQANLQEALQLYFEKDDIPPLEYVSFLPYVIHRWKHG